MGCWSYKHYKKVIIIIVDALRLDFMINTECYSGKEQQSYQKQFKKTLNIHLKNVCLSN